MYFTNPVVRIYIDRDLTLAAKEKYGGGSIVGMFEDPITLYRVLDGEELARIMDTGIIEGGMFAIPGERAYGACWSATLEGLPRWGVAWARGGARFGRLGKDLFIAKIEGAGRQFYHHAPKDVPFDPAGSGLQPSQINSDDCSTGLGCSVRAGAWEAQFFRVVLTGQLDSQNRPEVRLKPLTPEDVRKYVARKPLPDVALRPLGGTHAFGGTILGVTVLVFQDHNDKLWGVYTRDEKPFVLGAKTKKQAIDAAKVILDFGTPHHRGYVTYLNRLPPGFENVQEGQVWVDRKYHMPRRARVDSVGASYAYVTWLDRNEFQAERSTIDAKKFMKEFARVS
jgi:hypothetical protein